LVPKLPRQPIPELIEETVDKRNFRDPPGYIDIEQFGEISGGHIESGGIEVLRPR